VSRSEKSAEAVVVVDDDEGPKVRERSLCGSLIGESQMSAEAELARHADRVKPGRTLAVRS
jgi:hypothetical protein